MKDNPLRSLPSVDSLLAGESAQALIERKEFMKKRLDQVKAAVEKEKQPQKPAEKK